MLRVLPLALLLFACASSAQPDAVRGDVGRALDTYLTEQVSPDFSGVVLAVADGEVVLRKGYGMADRAAGVANTPETVFQIGSVTKPITAVLVMHLVDRGLIDPQALVSEYLGAMPPDKAEMTVHHLLTHTAGFPGGIGQDYDPIGREAYIQQAKATPLRTFPGDAYHYSNVGYALLAAIAEIVTGESYDVVLQGLLRTVEMQSTGYRLPASATIARGYRGDADLGLPHKRVWAVDGPHWHLRGNGGLLSSADDLLRLHDALEAGDLLSPEAFEAMHTPHTDEGPGSGSHYGYGWALFPTERGGTLAAHNGGDPGFTADFLRFRDDDAVLIVLSNDREVDATRLSEPLAEILFGGSPEPFRRGMREPLALDRLPDLLMGRRALAFAETITDADRDGVLAFMREHLDAGFNRDPDRFVAFVGAVKEEMGGSPFMPTRAEWDSEEGALIVYTMLDDGRGYMARLAFEPDGDHLIAGLYTDYADAPPEASGDLGEMPDTPAGRTVAELFRALEGSDDELRGFIETGLSADLRASYPEREHLELLRRLKADLDGAEIYNVDADRLTTVHLVLRQPTGGLLNITFRVEDAAPYGLSGLSVDG